MQKNIWKYSTKCSRGQNLLVNPEKTEEYSINRLSNHNWKNLGCLLGTEEDIKRRKLFCMLGF